MVRELNSFLAKEKDLVVLTENLMFFRVWGLCFLLSILLLQSATYIVFTDIIYRTSVTARRLPSRLI